jgi:hypothetical protein
MDRISIDISKERNEIKRSLLTLVADVLALGQSSTVVTDHEFETSYYRGSVRIYQGMIAEIKISRR